MAKAQSRRMVLGMTVHELRKSIEGAPRSALLPLGLGFSLQCASTLRAFCAEHALLETFGAFEQAVTACLANQALDDFDASKLHIDPADFVNGYFTLAAADLAALCYEMRFLHLENAKDIAAVICDEVERVSEDLTLPSAVTTIDNLAIPPAVATRLHVHAHLLESGDLPPTYFERCNLELFPPDLTPQTSV